MSDDLKVYGESVMVPLDPSEEALAAAHEAFVGASKVRGYAEWCERIKAAIKVLGSVSKETLHTGEPDAYMWRTAGSGWEVDFKAPEYATKVIPVHFCAVADNVKPVAWLVPKDPADADYPFDYFLIDPPDSAIASACGAFPVYRARKSLGDNNEPD